MFFFNKYNNHNKFIVVVTFIVLQLNSLAAQEIDKAADTLSISSEIQDTIHHSEGINVTGTDSLRIDSLNLPDVDYVFMKQEITDSARIEPIDLDILQLLDTAHINIENRNPYVLDNIEEETIKDDTIYSDTSNIYREKADTIAQLQDTVPVILEKSDVDTFVLQDMMQTIDTTWQAEEEYTDTILYPPNIIDLLQKGDGFFEQRFYTKANKYYLQALQNMEGDAVISLKIADAYRLNQQYVEAEQYYAKALEERKFASPMLYFYYADVLLKNKKYNQAHTWFEYYNSLIGNNSATAREFMRSIENLEKYFVDSIYFSIKPLEINSPESDFSPTIYKDGLIFVSSRQLGETEIGKRYYDLYYSEVVDSNNTYNTPRRLRNQLNTKYHEGPLVFSQNNSQLLLTRSSFSEKRNDVNEVLDLSIYTSFLSDLDSELDSLSKIEIENFNYSMGHPAVSTDGKTLFFVSNAPGGYGNTDIYYTTLENGTWSFPKNLGEKINTGRNEMFPFLQHDSILYFASDGHGGLGGLDIFRVNIANEDAEIKNLGYPINSSKDDFGLIYSNDIREGYFSSNRSGGMGSDDIYSFSVNKVRFKPFIKSEESGDPITDIRVSVMDILDSTIIIRDTTKAYPEFDLVTDREYSVSISGDKYEEETHIISTDVNNLVDILEPVLMTIEVRVDPEYIEPEFDLEPDEPEYTESIDIGINFRVQIAASRSPMKEKELKKKYGGNLPITMFEEDGWYKYIIGEYDSYYEAKESLNASGVKDAFVAAYEDEITKLPLKQAIFEKYVVPVQHTTGNSIFGTENVEIKNHFRIHFKHDQFYINEEYKMVLDSAVNVMKSNDNIRLEISGHTDITGNFDYNMALSRERTNKVYDYVISKGIEDYRIITYSYGESKLLKYCTKDCTEETHQLNRRVEIILYYSKN